MERDSPKPFINRPCLTNWHLQCYKKLEGREMVKGKKRHKKKEKTKKKKEDIPCRILYKSIKERTIESII